MRFGFTRVQLWVDPDTLCLDFIEFHRNIEEMFRNNLITSREYQAYQMVLRYNRIKLYYLKQERFESCVVNVFLSRKSSTETTILLRKTICSMSYDDEMNSAICTSFSSVCQRGDG
jgi:hypothetical protein